MANKYIIHGATFNGDGTSSAEATVDGGVGAWNNINVWEGTAPAYGTLAAEDTVYIRSKTSGGADVVVSMSANVTLGSAAATESSPITWVVDGGEVWSGIAGKVQYNGGTPYKLTITANNPIIAYAKDKFAFAVATFADWYEYADIQSSCKNFLLDISANTSGNLIIWPRIACNIVLESFHFKVGATSTSVEHSLIFLIEHTGDFTFVDIDYELTQSSVGKNAALFRFYGDNYDCDLKLIGGKIHGPGSIAGLPLFMVYAADRHNMYFKGIDIPNYFPLYKFWNPPSYFDLVCADENLGGYFKRPWGYYTSRTDNNPPTLNAQLPNTTLTKWAWRVCPLTATRKKPARLEVIKYYTDTEAARTISLDVLVANTLPLDKSNAWITVEYTDSTGEKRHASSQTASAAALDTSTAGWSSTTWGMVTCTKNKFSVTTEYAIKQNTTVIVAFWTHKAGVSESDIIFVDPDVTIV